MTHDADVLEAIRAFIAEHGYSPTVRELAATFGYASPSSMHRRLLMLRDAGKVTFTDSPRTLRIVE